MLIDKNPFPYVGTFNVSHGAVPYVHVRVKMGESSNVRVVSRRTASTTRPRKK